MLTDAQVYYMTMIYLWSIYFDHHLPLKPSIGKRWKQSCTPNKYRSENNFGIIKIIMKDTQAGY